MTERLFSDRWNWWTLDREQAEKMKLHFNEQTDENINIAVDGIDLDLNDDCLECGDQVTINESIP